MNKNSVTRQNLLLTWADQRKSTRYNLWLNGILIFGFLLINFIFTLQTDSDSPFWINPELHAYYVTFSIIALGYFILRAEPSLNKSRYFPLCVGCVGIITNYVFWGLIVHFHPTWDEMSSGMLLVLYAPWGEESLRLINYIVIFDLLNATHKSFWGKKISAFIIAHLLFYFMHYQRYDVFSIEIIFHIGLGFFFLTIPLLLTDSYFPPLLIHASFNLSLLIYGQSFARLWIILPVVAITFGISFLYFLHTSSGAPTSSNREEKT